MRQMCNRAVRASSPGLQPGVGADERSNTPVPVAPAAGGGVSSGGVEKKKKGKKKK